METTKSRKPRRHLRSRKTRRLILDNAKEVFIAEGYSKTTIEKIRVKTGVGYATVFSHFKGKDDILTNIVTSYFNDFFESQDKLKEPRNEEQLIKAYKEFILSLLELGKEQKAIMKVYQDALIQSFIVADHWEHVANNLCESIACSLTENQGDGLVRDFDVFEGTKVITRLLSALFWDTVNKKDDDLEGAANAAVDIIFRGILR